MKYLNVDKINFTDQSLLISYESKDYQLYIKTIDNKITIRYKHVSSVEKSKKFETSIKNLYKSIFELEIDKNIKSIEHQDGFYHYKIFYKTSNNNFMLRQFNIKDISFETTNDDCFINTSTVEKIAHYIDSVKSLCKEISELHKEL